jgi:tryptophan halogenase
MLNRKLGGHCSIHVVDTPEPLSPGHAEVTLPTVLELVRFLGLDQNDFIDKTQSTYSLATRYVDWPAIGESFWHGRGTLGALIERRPFYHFWHKARSLGLKLKLEPFSHEVSFAQANRFIFPGNSLGVAQHLRYALHTDSTLLARYLRAVAERGGVIRLERKVVGATRHENGGLDELQFEDGGTLRADLFIDCTGARSQLLGEFLGVGWHGWSQWLPCDREVSFPAALADVRPPYVQNNGLAAGWRWRMPLQQAFSFGQVYSSAHQADDAALSELLAAAASEPLAEPRLREIRAGRREVSWRHNVVAVGDSFGALDPLAGTDHHMISNAVFNLLDHFPDRQLDASNIASYNAGMSDEFERIRDFTLAHYALSRREDSAFWRDRAALPAELAHRVQHYRATGRVVLQKPELFSDLDWFWVFEGMGVTPADYDPLIDTVDYEQVKRVMVAISQKVSADTSAAPSHDSFFAAANARLAGVRKSAATAAAAASPAN